MSKMLKTALSGLLVLVCAAAALGQTPGRDARVISARAGGVNFVSGPVEFNREGETSWNALTVKDELKSGDAVRAGANGRVEVLLNPGSYLRAGEGAQFELADTSLEDLRLRLTRGSAVVEATGYGGADLSITFETPQGRARIVRSGIYRFNVLPSGVTEVAVLKGRVTLGDGDGAQVVKGGHLVRFTGAGAPEVAKAKFKKEERDALDLWSRERGKELAKLNEKLSAQHASAAFESFNNSFSHTFYPRVYGVWYFNARGGCYTFVPFQSSWSSPYGHSYWNYYYVPSGNCHLCAGGRQSGRNNPGGAQPGTNSGAGRQTGGGGVARPSSPPVRERPTPPRNFPRPMPRGRGGDSLPGGGRMPRIPVDN